MYAVVTWEIDPASADPVQIEDQALDALGQRKICAIYDGIRIADVTSTTDFLRLHEALQGVADEHPQHFRFAAWALRSGSPMRTSKELDFDRDCAREVVNG